MEGDMYTDEGPIATDPLGCGIQMKDSGIPWIGMIPAVWSIDKIGRLMNNIGSGGTPKADNPKYYSDTDGIPFVTISDMSNTDYITSTKKHLTEAGIIDKKLTIYSAGTVLYSIYATLGKASELSVQATINQAILALTPNEKITNSFLKYALNAMEGYVVSLSNSNTQNNLSAKTVSNMMLPLPELSIQKQISSHLDRECAKIDESIGIQKDLISKLKELKQSIITETVTKGLDPNAEMKDVDYEWMGSIPSSWSICKLNLYADVHGGCTPQRSDKRYWSNGTINWMSSGEVNRVYIYDTDEKITEDALNETALKMSPVNTVVVALNGQGKTKGMSAILKVPSTHNQSLASFIADETHLHFNYLFYLFQALYKYLRLNVGDGSRDGLSIDYLKRTMIPIPSFDEQMRIASFLDGRCSEIDELVKMCEDSISKTESLKQSLIYEYVTGKKIVKEGC